MHDPPLLGLSHVVVMGMLRLTLACEVQQAVQQAHACTQHPYCPLGNSQAT